jgi:hypothetical protein
MEVISIQNQNDFLREWLNYRSIYLQEILGLEAPPPARECFSCQSVPGIYRCTDCIRDHMSCLRCCTTLHDMTTYHRIKRWNGIYFEGSDLGTWGIVMHVGHGGSECPSYSTSLSGQSHTGAGMHTEDAEDGWEDEVNVNEMDGGEGDVGGIDGLGGMGSSDGQDIWGPDILGTHWLVVVTSTGVFQHQIHWCQCPGAADPHIQLL